MRGDVGPGLLREFVADTGNESAGEADGRDARRWERIMAHDDGVIDFLPRFAGGKMAVVKRRLIINGDRVDAGLDMEKLRSRKPGTGCGVKDVVGAVFGAVEKMVVRDESDLAVGAEVAGGDLGWIGLGDLVDEVVVFGQEQAKTAGLVGGFPGEDGEGLHLVGEVGHEIETIDVAAHKSGVGFHIDEGEGFFQTVGKTLLLVELERMRGATGHGLN